MLWTNATQLLLLGLFQSSGNAHRGGVFPLLSQSPLSPDYSSPEIPDSRYHRAGRNTAASLSHGSTYSTRDKSGRYTDEHRNRLTHSLRSNSTHNHRLKDPPADIPVHIDSEEKTQGKVIEALGVRQTACNPVWSMIVFAFFLAFCAWQAQALK